MDAMRARAYLTLTMLRRLLACLALITGLAAVATPAHARMNPVMAQQVEECAVGLPARAQLTCVIGSSGVEETLRNPLPSKARPRPPVVIYIPTVQFGPDRARE
jgi:hypothetical protein